MAIGSFDGEENAAGSAVGVDLLAQEEESWRVSGKKRSLVGVALVGSAAVGDAMCDVKIGERFVMRIKNSQAGANVIPNRDDMVYVPKGAYVPAGQPVQLVVVDSSGTNPLVYRFVFRKWKTFTRRSYSKRSYGYKRRY